MHIEPFYEDNLFKLIPGLDILLIFPNLLS